MDPKPVALRLRLPYQDEREFIERYALHIARGGIFVATRSPKPEGTPVSFEFRLADDSCPLAGEGVVIKSQGVEAGTRAGMTIRFTSLSDQGKAVVEKALAFKGERAPAPASEIAPWLQSPSAVPLEIAEARKRRRETLLAGPRVLTAEETAPVIGIDFGTTQSRAAILADGRIQLFVLDGKQSALPSVVAVDPKGRFLVGNRAKAHALLDPRHSVFALKRLLCRPFVSGEVDGLGRFLPLGLLEDGHGEASAELRGTRFAMADLAGHLLSEIRDRASEHLRKRVRRVVVAVPASFTNVQREAVRDAAEAADLVVERLINDTTSVALAYGYGKGIPRRRVLVCDFGGGKLSVSVVQMTGDDLEIIATGGDTRLGGVDFDLKLAGELLRRFGEATGISIEDPVALQRVRDAAESLKILLSDKTEAVARVPAAASHNGAPIDLDLPMTRLQFESLSSDLLDRAVKACAAVLETPALGAASLDEVLLVGGQSRIPAVRARFESAFGRPVRADFDSGGAVASGAAILAQAYEDPEGWLPARRVSEVLGSWIGVAARDGRFVRVLDCNTPVPCQKSCVIPSSQRAPIRLAVFQGAGPSTAGTDFQGSVQLSPAAGAESSLVFSLSVDGLLTISARRTDGELAPLSLERLDSRPEALTELLTQSPFPASTEGQGVLAGLKRLFRGAVPSPSGRGMG
jgi:molecular chaperone DnaK